MPSSAPHGRSSPCAARSIAQVDDAVTLPQYRALVASAARGPQRVTDLAEELGVHPSSVTRMCDRLERPGRSPGS